MKILVFSDTHGVVQPMQKVLQREADAQLCLHLGDGLDKFLALQEDYPSIRFHSVCGNCDHALCQPQEVLLNLQGHTLYLTHGDCLHVKLGLTLLWEHAKRHKANIALFGHTHRSFYEFKNGIHLFNPGSLGKPLPGIKSHYGLIHLHENEMPTFNIMTL